MKIKSLASMDKLSRVLGFSRSLPSIVMLAALLVSLHVTGPAIFLGTAHAEDAPASQPKPHEADLSTIGKKLSNPLSNLWSLQFALGGPQFYDGDINEGEPELGADLTFQPVIHMPLFGTGEDQWALVTRPVIPFIFNTPIPKGQNSFDNKGGIGDIQLPLLVNPSKRLVGNMILGAGPVFQLPSATNNDLGSDQWAMGPAAVIGYEGKNATFGVFPNWFWKIGGAGQGSKPDVKKMSILYFFNYMLPDAWQIGMVPTITYNDKASSGNKWSVPVGPYIGKTIKVGKLPLNIRFGGEYSVVSPDDFGQRFQFRLLITPVIPSLIQKPILGG